MEHAVVHERITPETVHDFFAAQVRRLRDTRVQVEQREGADAGQAKLRVFAPGAPAPENARSLLERFVVPLGAPIETENSDVKKFGHDYAPDYSDRTGFVTHVGDEPYDGIAQRHFHAKEKSITQTHLNEKTRSIKLAIEHYMPPQVFAEYLTFFRENLDMPSHQEALRESLDAMKRQLMVAKPLTPTQDVRAAIAERNPEQAQFVRLNAHATREAKTIAPHPDIVLALAVYHAAHRSYLSRLSRAFTEAKIEGHISEEQFDTASYVLKNTSFEQFAHFNLFVGYMPMLMLQLDAQPKQKPYAEAVKDSMAKSWEDFFATKVLTREYSAMDIPAKGDRPAGGSLTCPAKAHMKATADSKLLQETFDFVAHNPTLEKPRALAQAAAHEVQAQLEGGSKGWWRW